MTAAQPIGPVLDALGVQIELAPGQQVTEAVVIAKVADFTTEGGTALVITDSKGLDWVARRGLITGGLWLLDETGLCVCDDDE